MHLKTWKNMENQQDSLKRFDCAFPSLRSNIIYLII